MKFSRFTTLKTTNCASCSWRWSRIMRNLPKRSPSLMMSGWTSAWRCRRTMATTSKFSRKMIWSTRWWSRNQRKSWKNSVLSTLLNFSTTSQVRLLTSPSGIKKWILTLCLLLRRDRSPQRIFRKKIWSSTMFLTWMRLICRRERWNCRLGRIKTRFISRKCQFRRWPIFRKPKLCLVPCFKCTMESHATMEICTQFQLIPPQSLECTISPQKKAITSQPLSSSGSILQRTCTWTRPSIRSFHKSAWLNRLEASDLRQWKLQCLMMAFWYALLLEICLLVRRQESCSQT